MQDPQTIFCPRCGTRAGDATWCSNCGLNLRLAVSTPAAQAERERGGTGGEEHLPPPPRGKPARVLRVARESGFALVGEGWRRRVAIIVASGCLLGLGVAGGVLTVGLLSGGWPRAEQERPNQRPAPEGISQATAETTAIGAAYEETPSGVDRADLNSTCSQGAGSWTCEVTTTSGECTEYAIGTVTVGSGGEVVDQDLTCNGGSLSDSSTTSVGVAESDAEEAAIGEAYGATPSDVDRDDLEASCSEVGDSWSCEVSTSSTSCEEYSLGTVTVDSSGEAVESDLECNGVPVGMLMPGTGMVAKVMGLTGRTGILSLSRLIL